MQNPLPVPSQLSHEYFSVIARSIDDQTKTMQKFGKEMRILDVQEYKWITCGTVPGHSEGAYTPTESSRVQSSPVRL